MAGRKFKWSSEREDVLKELIGEGFRGRRMCKEFLKRCPDAPYTSSSIESRATRLREQRGIEDEVTDAGNHVEDEETDEIATCELIEAIEGFDEKNLYPLLREREHLMYGILSEQARRIRDYDLFGQYSTLTGAEIAILDMGRRRECTDILLRGKPVVDRVDLVSITGYGERRDEVTVLLPLFFKDAKSPPRDDLRSRLYGSVHAAFVHENGFQESKYVPLLGNLRDLTTCNFNGPHVDYQKKIKDSVEGRLKKVDGGISVFVLEDHPLSFYMLNEG